MLVGAHEPASGRRWAAWRGGAVVIAATVLLSAVGCSSLDREASGTPTPSADASNEKPLTSPAPSSTGATQTPALRESPLAVVVAPSSLDPYPAEVARLHIDEDCVTITMRGERRLLAFNKGYASWDATRAEIRFESIGGGVQPPISLHDGQRMHIAYEADLGFTVPADAWIVPPDPTCPSDVVRAFAIQPA